MADNIKTTLDVAGIAGELASGSILFNAKNARHLSKAGKAKAKAKNIKPKNNKIYSKPPKNILYNLKHIFRAKLLNMINSNYKAAKLFVNGRDLIHAVTTPKYLPTEVQTKVLDAFMDNNWHILKMGKY